MIDIERLRSDLLNHFGGAMTVFKEASMEYLEALNASDERLISIADKSGCNLNDYIIEEEKER